MCTSVHVCVSVCTVCARVSVSVVHGVHSVQNVVGPDGGFQRVFCEVCAHLQNVSDSVAELDAPREQVDGSEICARIRKNSSGKDFSLGSKSEPWRQIRELFRPEGKVATFPGAPGAVRGRIWRFGQIWRPGGYSN